MRAPALPVAVRERSGPRRDAPGYTAERYLTRLAEARATITDLAVSTDIIVGFPGETEADFQHTMEVAAAAEYDYAYMFLFSPREGTEAATMEGDFVDPVVAGERFRRLRIVVERAALAKHEARVGRVEEVLVEGPSKRDPSVTSGRTRQNKLVHFTPPMPLRTGSYASVEITHGAPHHLLGTSSSSSPNPPTACASPSPPSERDSRHHRKMPRIVHVTYEFRPSSGVAPAPDGTGPQIVHRAHDSRHFSDDERQ